MITTEYRIIFQKGNYRLVQKAADDFVIEEYISYDTWVIRDVFNNMPLMVPDKTRAFILNILQKFSEVTRR